MRALGLAVAIAAGISYPLDHVGIDAALAIANSSFESDHRRFHADYHFPVESPPVDFVSLVTPFRRIVLTAETDARLGRRRFGQREALAALQPEPDRVEVFAELTFHPHHTFVGMPDYTIELEAISPGGRAIVPKDVERLPRFGPRLENPWYPFAYPFRPAPRMASRAESLRGGTLIGRFAAGQLDVRGTYAVVVRGDVKELARTRVDLARLR